VNSSSSAAQMKLKCLATEAKTRSWRRLAFFVKNYLILKSV
jgi:hypothetical protein